MKHHPVISTILERKKNRSKPRHRDDSHKIGLVIEGGNMRGVICGGMIAGLETLDLLNSFDAIYGTSAGAITGAYLIARQARFGTRIYYEDLNNKNFINFARFFIGRPIVNLDYLFNDVMINRKPLDHEAVINSPIPLNAIVTNVDDMLPEVINHFKSKEELFQALRASANMSIAAGPPVKIGGKHYLDGGLFEPIPIRYAEEDSCTHILVLLTRPYGSMRGVYPNFIKRLVLNRIRSGLGDAHNVKDYVAKIEYIREKTEQVDGNPYVCGIFPEPPEVSGWEKRYDVLLQANKKALKTTIETFGYTGKVLDNLSVKNLGIIKA